MLDDYLTIAAGDKPPRFHRCGSQTTRISREDLGQAGLEELWPAHDEAMELLRAGRPGPRRLAAAGLLQVKQAIAGRILESCCFCERRCHADRAAGETGDCGVPAETRYASEFLHYGEEPELVPSHTIFFTGCNFSCVYCQNWDIATRPLSGDLVDAVRLARVIDRNRQTGSRNVNFVGGNPDPHLHTCLDIVSRLESDVPVVWNSNAYASLETMKLLEGIADVFLSDFRYGNDACAQRYSDVSRYTEVVTRNLELAGSQAEVMIRHLVLPGHLECCTRPIMRWTAHNLPGVYFNLMFQYRPEHKAKSCAGIDRLLEPAEMSRARSMMREYGLDSTTGRDGG
jgi:putative pyruvate formate lyase activating enzyme